MIQRSRNHAGLLPGIRDNLAELHIVDLIVVMMRF